jgi:hypothetical protein
MFFRTGFLYYIFILNPELSISDSGSREFQFDNCFRQATMICVELKQVNKTYE